MRGKLKLRQLPDALGIGISLERLTLIYHLLIFQLFPDVSSFPTYQQNSLCFKPCNSVKQPCNSVKYYYTTYKDCSREVTNFSHISGWGLGWWHLTFKEESVDN